jgi:D-alanyl-D-alanine dipeptidase
MLLLLIIAASDVGLATPPDGFVDLRDVVPGIVLDIRYHTANNFTGAPRPGYGVPAAWMRNEAAAALALVQSDLQNEGLGLLVYDAYRPVRGTSGMAAWAERTGQLVLFQTGYIAHKSGHNHGHTVDLTIQKDGVAIDMGTPWDTLTTDSNTKNAKGTALANRLKLKAAMEARGFKAYHKEWWHFGFPVPGTTPRDVPYGCFEPPEGQWKPPKGWTEPGFQMPKSIKIEPCR